MDSILKQKITDKLRTYLNREPSESEVINGQTDATLMQWIAQDDATTQNETITQLAIFAGTDVQTLQTQVSLQATPNTVL